MPTPVLLYWNWQSLKWQDTEDFSINGGATLGKQWFMPPPFFVYKGGNKFTHQQIVKLDYEILQVGQYETEMPIWVGTRQNPPDVDLQTDPNSQMPFLIGKDQTGTYDGIHWLIPNPHPRFARGKVEMPPIS